MLNLMLNIALIKMFYNTTHSHELLYQSLSGFPDFICEIVKPGFIYRNIHSDTPLRQLTHNFSGNSIVPRSTSRMITLLPEILRMIFWYLLTVFLSQRATGLPVQYH